MTDEKKPVTKFGSIQDQFATIGGRSITAEEPVKQQEVKQSKRQQEVKQSKRQTVKTAKITEDEREEVRQQTIYVPKSLQKWAKVFAAENDKDISDVYVEALREYKERRV